MYGQAPLVGSTIDPRLFIHDFSTLNKANELKAQGTRDLGATIAQGVTQVGDYFKQQGEKKKLIKQSDVQIDAALKLFPEMASVLQPYKDQIRDENVSLDERSFIAGQTGDFITNSLNMMKMKSAMELAREREARMGASAAPASAGTPTPANKPIVW